RVPERAWGFNSPLPHQSTPEGRPPAKPAGPVSPQRWSWPPHRQLLTRPTRSSVKDQRPPLGRHLPPASAARDGGRPDGYSAGDTFPRALERARERGTGDRVRRTDRIGGGAPLRPPRF